MNKQMRLTEEELSTIKALFADNEPALKMLRKIFLPEVSADAPLGQNIDLWMSVNVDNMSATDAVINIKARNTVIGHVENCLLQLSALAGRKDETTEQTMERLQANSNK